MFNTEQNDVYTEKSLIPFNKDVIERTSEIATSLALEKIVRPSLTTFDALFPEQERDEKNKRIVRETLGAIANEFSEMQLRDLMTEIEFLTESWLDDFEKQIFKGKTLNELLHEKGGL